MQQMSEGKFFSCPQCQAVFDGIKKLQVHSLQAHQVELTGLPNQLIQSSFDDEGESVEGPPTPFICHVCGKSFGQAELRDQHVARRHSTYFCEFCPLVFNSDPSRQAHMRKAHGATVITEVEMADDADVAERFSAVQQNAFVCPLCPEAFETVESCLAHQQQNHHVDPAGGNDSAGPEDTYEAEDVEADGATMDKRLACEFCHRLYKNKENLKKHRRATHAQELKEKVQLEGPNAVEIVRETCEYCGKYFSNLGNLQRHVMNHLMVPCSSSGSRPPKPEEICFCRFCGKRFAVRAVCRFHETCVHQCRQMQQTAAGTPATPLPKLFCHFCGQMFPDENLYQLHTNEHEKELHKRLWCSVCDQQHPTMDSLLSHMDQHVTVTTSTEAEGVASAQQAEGFEDDLQTTATHQVKPGRKQGFGRKKYDCYFCPKSYDSHADMLRHERGAHWDAAVGGGYRCKLCGKSFQRRTQLNGHTAQHREKVHRCKYCETGFPRVVERRQHERDCEVRVKKKIPILTCQLQCRHCGQRFLNAVFCRRHEQRQHGSTKDGSLLRCTACGEILESTAEWHSHKETCPFGELADGDYELIDGEDTHGPPSANEVDSHEAKAPSQLKPFSCGWCDMTFGFAEECGIHEEELHGA